MGTKIIKSNSSSDAGVVVADNTVRMTVKEDNGITVAENGTTLSGPLSLVSNPSQIRVGGLWTFNSPFNLMIPSTYATPQAVLMVDPPIKQLETIMEQTAVMIGLLSAVSAL